MTAGSDPGNTQMPIQQQSQSGGPGCQKIMGVLTLLMLAALLVLGYLAFEHLAAFWAVWDRNSKKRFSNKTQARY